MQATESGRSGFLCGTTKFDRVSVSLESPGGTPDQSERRGAVGEFLFGHTIDVYPSGRRRAQYLGLAVLATVVLYYVYYTQTGVTPNILAGYHMSFAFYIGIIVVSNLLGAFASLPASQTDRLGRTNVVIYGLLIVGLLTAVGIPLAPNQWTYAVITCFIGIVEGAILVATPALVRDFSPQLGRASAMGFWTIGPVAGSLVTSLVALHTLDHFGQTHWKSQFVISGVAALVVFLLSLFALKDLSASLRDQLMVSARDQALVEARARGLTERQLVAARERPWRQILQWDLVGASIGIAAMLLVYYAAASLFTIYYPVIFKNVNGTNFSVTQANGLNTWFWGADIVALIVVGLLSDALRVRKPFMLVGALLSMVMLVIFLGDATHAHTGYYTLALEASLLAVGLSLVFGPWMAGYTESVEEKNPALVGTGLALWGWILRLVVGTVVHCAAAGHHQRESHCRQPSGGRHGDCRTVGAELRGRTSGHHQLRRDASAPAQDPGQGSGRRRGGGQEGRHAAGPGRGGEGLRAQGFARAEQVQGATGEVRRAVHGATELH